MQAGDAQEIPTPQWISGKGFLRRGERKGHRVPDHPVDTSVCWVMRSLGVNIFNLLVPSCLRSMYMPVVKMQLNFNSWISVSET